MGAPFEERALLSIPKHGSGVASGLISLDLPPRVCYSIYKLAVGGQAAGVELPLKPRASPSPLDGYEYRLKPMIGLVVTRQSICREATSILYEQHTLCLLILTC